MGSTFAYDTRPLLGIGIAVSSLVLAAIITYFQSIAMLILRFLAVSFGTAMDDR